MRLLKFLSLFLVVTSCRTLNPHVMFDVPKGYPIVSDTTSANNREYLIGTNDRLEMHLYSIEGFRLVDVTNSAVGGIGSEAISYIVEDDGQVKLPVLGKVPIAGLPLRKAERFLEERYSVYYKNPFIMLKVTNRHCIVFFGDNGHGAIVSIVNDNTTIIEAIAMAGGLSDNSKAWRLKILRGDLHNPQVHIVDLSSLAGMKASDLTVQSNDVIYVESTPNYKQKLLAQLTPFLGILTAVLLVANLVK